MEGMNLDRRAFTRLAAAALGGLLAGQALGRADDKKAPIPKKDPNRPMFLQEPHICRGLNTCKGKGQGGGNDCAGMGNCAAAPAHVCAGDNDCAGLDGCGGDAPVPGENKCKGLGQGSVPIFDRKIWELARGRFEAQMTKAGRKFGPAPEKPRREKRG